MSQNTDSDQMRRLYDVADDGEASILDDLRRRAGLTWECYGDSDLWHWTNTEDAEICDNCGLPRSLGELRPDDRPRTSTDG